MWMSSDNSRQEKRSPTQARAEARLGLNRGKLPVNWPPRLPTQVRDQFAQNGDPDPAGRAPAFRDQPFHLHFNNGWCLESAPVGPEPRHARQILQVGRAELLLEKAFL